MVSRRDGSGWEEVQWYEVRLQGASDLRGSGQRSLTRKKKKEKKKDTARYAAEETPWNEMDGRLLFVIGNCVSPCLN